MPAATRLFLKTSLVCFVLALVVGALRWAPALGVQSEWLMAVYPSYLHVLVFGWITQLIMGVAIWLFPVADRDQPRGNPVLNYGAYAGINSGLLLRLIAEPSSVAYPEVGVWAWLLLGSAILQWAGGMCFVVNIWERVKGRGR